jgi:predicted O-methyltransferase YrrM
MKGTPLTDEIYEYIVHNFAQDERSLLGRMRKRAEQAGMPMIMISEEQARFVEFFVKAIHAKRVLDVGTLFGYSAAIMARAIGSAGEVVSLEFSELHANVARQNLEAEGITNVQVIQGPALDALKGLPDASFDFALIDADKVNYVNYLNECLRLVKPGGVIAGDNALAWGKIADESLAESDEDYTSVTSVRKFNTQMAIERRLFSAVVPIGDGMAMGVVE